MQAHTWIAIFLPSLSLNLCEPRPHSISDYLQLKGVSDESAPTAGHRAEETSACERRDDCSCYCRAWIVEIAQEGVECKYRRDDATEEEVTSQYLGTASTGYRVEYLA